MLQYLINTSIVWLACLLVYELLLRRERFHQYNRLYLLFSLAAGLLLPLVHFEVPRNNSTFSQPVAQVYQIKNTIGMIQPDQPQVITTDVQNDTAPAASTSATFRPSTLLWVIYLAGVLAGLLFIARETVYLVGLYTRGRKSYEQGCRLVATGMHHCPFSFFNIIFVRSREEYSREEWDLLIAHEKEHGRQLHSLDNVLLIMLRIMFWFNPLPHIYFKKLRVVHEYQADHVAAADPAGYGQFLLEQTMLQAAPILTHSFNYSPLKNRIAMLTEAKTKRTALLKYLSVLPLLLILIVFCTTTSFTGKTGSSAMRTNFKGNEIEFAEKKVLPFEYIEALDKQKQIFQYVALPDSVLVKDIEAGTTTMQPVPVESTPVALNGRPVIGNEYKYKLTEPPIVYIEPRLKGPENDLAQYLFEKLRKDLNRLENGTYEFAVENVVVDENGEIAYYEAKGIVPGWVAPGEQKPVISTAMDAALKQKLTDVLDGQIQFRPAVTVRDQKPANVRLQIGAYEIDVRSHRAKLVERKGC